MEPLGYVVLQHGVRLDRPVKAFEKWMLRIPGVYREATLDSTGGEGLRIADDPRCLGMLKHYHSLVPMAQEARKPLFNLRPADGAIGAHQQAVQRAYADFSALAERIVEKMDSIRRP